MLIWLYVTNKEVSNPWNTCNAVTADSLQNGVTEVQLFPVELRGNPIHRVSTPVPEQRSFSYTADSQSKLHRIP